MTVARSTPQEGLAVEDLSVDDFVTGLLAGLAGERVNAISLRGSEFYRAVADAFQYVWERAADENLDLRFRIFVDKVYGDSPVVRDAISGAVQRDLVSLDNPEYLDMRLKISPDEARLLLDSLPGRAGFFVEVARHFVSEYPWMVFEGQSAGGR